MNYKFCCILLLFSYISLLLSSHFTLILTYPPNPFYLFSNISFIYWIGLGFLITLIILKINLCGGNKILGKLLDIGILIFVSSYYYVGSFIYSTIRYADSYNFYWNFVNPIISAGSLGAIDRTGMYSTVFNQATIFFTYLFQLNSNPHLISNYFPIFVIILGSVLTYALATKYSNQYGLLGGIAFILLGCGLFHLSPQHYAYILAFFSIYLIFKLLLFGNVENNTQKKYLVLLIIFIMAILFSHLLTSIILLYTLVMVLIFGIVVDHIMIRSNHESDYKNITFMNIGNFILPISILFVGLMGYLLHYGYYYFKKLVFFSDGILDSVLNYDPYAISLVHRTVVNTSPSDLYQLAYQMRIEVLIVYSVIGIVSSLFMYYFYYYRRNVDIWKPYLIGAATFFLVLFSFGAILILSGNSNYGFGRALPISLIPLGILITALYSQRIIMKHSIKMALKIFIILTLIVLMVIAPITNYASDPYHFYSESEDKANKFGMSYLDDFVIISGYNWVISKITYNRMVLKEQSGLEYLNKFVGKNVNKIYDVGDNAKMYRDVIT